MAINYNDSNKFMATVSFYEGYINHLWDIVTISNMNEDGTVSKYNTDLLFCTNGDDEEKGAFKFTYNEHKIDYSLLEFTNNGILHTDMKINDDLYVDNDLVVFQDMYTDSITLHGDMSMDDLDLMDCVIDSDLIVIDTRVNGALFCNDAHLNNVEYNGNVTFDDVTVQKGATFNSACTVQTMQVGGGLSATHMILNSSLVTQSIITNTVKMKDLDINDAINATNAYIGSQVYVSNSGLKNINAEFIPLSQNSIGVTNIDGGVVTIKDNMIIKQQQVEFNTFVQCNDLNTHEINTEIMSVNSVATMNNSVVVNTLKSSGSSFFGDVITTGVVADKMNVNVCNVGHANIEYAWGDMTIHEASINSVCVNSELNIQDLKTPVLNVYELFLNDLYINYLNVEKDAYFENVECTGIELNSHLHLSKIEMNSYKMYCTQGVFNIDNGVTNAMYMNSKDVVFANCNITLNNNVLSNGNIECDYLYTNSNIFTTSMVINNTCKITIDGFGHVDNIPGVTQDEHGAVTLNSPMFNIGNETILDCLDNIRCLKQCNFENDLVVNNKVYVDNLDFNSNKYVGDLLFQSAEFGNSVTFETGMFENCILFRNNTTFKIVNAQELNAGSVTFADTECTDVNVGNRAYCNNVYASEVIAHKAYLNDICLNYLNFEADNGNVVINNSTLSINSVQIENDLVTIDCDTNIEVDLSIKKNFYVENNLFCSATNINNICISNETITGYSNSFLLQNSAGDSCIYGMNSLKINSIEIGNTAIIPYDTTVCDLNVNCNMNTNTLSLTSLHTTDVTVFNIQTASTVINNSLNVSNCVYFNCSAYIGSENNSVIINGDVYVRGFFYSDTFSVTPHQNCSLFEDNSITFTQLHPNCKIGIYINSQSGPSLSFQNSTWMVNNADVNLLGGSKLRMRNWSICINECYESMDFYKNEIVQMRVFPKIYNPEGVLPVPPQMDAYVFILNNDELMSTFVFELYDEYGYDINILNININLIQIKRNLYILGSLFVGGNLIAHQDILLPLSLHTGGLIANNVNLKDTLIDSDASIANFRMPNSLFIDLPNATMTNVDINSNLYVQNDIYTNCAVFNYVVTDVMKIPSLHTNEMHAGFMFAKNIQTNTGTIAKLNIRGDANVERVNANNTNVITNCGFSNALYQNSIGETFVYGDRVSIKDAFVVYDNSIEITSPIQISSLHVENATVVELVSNDKGSFNRVNASSLQVSGETYLGGNVTMQNILGDMQTNELAMNNGNIGTLNANSCLVSDMVGDVMYKTGDLNINYLYSNAVSNCVDFEKGVNIDELNVSGNATFNDMNIGDILINNTIGVRGGIQFESHFIRHTTNCITMSSMIFMNSADITLFHNSIELDTNVSIESDLSVSSNLYMNNVIVNSLCIGSVIVNSNNTILGISQDSDGKTYIDNVLFCNGDTLVLDCSNSPIVAHKPVVYEDEIVVNGSAVLDNVDITGILHATVKINDYEIKDEFVQNDPVNFEGRVVFNSNIEFNNEFVINSDFVAQCSDVYFENMETNCNAYIDTLWGNNMHSKSIHCSQLYINSFTIDDVYFKINEDNNITIASSTLLNVNDIVMVKGQECAIGANLNVNKSVYCNSIRADKLVVGDIDILDSLIQDETGNVIIYGNDIHTNDNLKISSELVTAKALECKNIDITGYALFISKTKSELSRLKNVYCGCMCALNNTYMESAYIKSDLVVESNMFVMNPNEHIQNLFDSQEASTISTYVIKQLILDDTSSGKPGIYISNSLDESPGIVYQNGTWNVKDSDVYLSKSLVIGPWEMSVHRVTGALMFDKFGKTQMRILPSMEYASYTGPPRVYHPCSMDCTCYE